LIGKKHQGRHGLKGRNLSAQGNALCLRQECFKSPEWATSFGQYFSITING